MIKDTVDVFITIFSFTLFAVIHSYLASNRVKKYLSNKYGNLIAFYRLTYNLFALLTFYFVYEVVPHPIDIIYDLPYPFDFIILIPQFLSLAGIIWALKYFDVKEFLGINQIFRWLNKDFHSEDLDEKLTLNIKGPYKICRHPLYLFTILFLAFRSEMDLFYLTLVVLAVAYFYIGSFYEEKKLVENFGEVYKEYQESVPRIFPLRFSLRRNLK